MHQPGFLKYLLSNLTDKNDVRFIRSSIISGDFSKPTMVRLHDFADKDSVVKYAQNGCGGIMPFRRFIIHLRVQFKSTKCDMMCVLVYAITFE